MWRSDNLLESTLYSVMLVLGLELRPAVLAAGYLLPIEPSSWPSNSLLEKYSDKQSCLDVCSRCKHRGHQLFSQLSESFSR